MHFKIIGLTLATALLGSKGTLAASKSALPNDSVHPPRAIMDRKQVSWGWPFYGGCFGYRTYTHVNKKGIDMGDGYMRLEFIPAYCAPA